jgi:hypothetical protein
MACNSGLGFVMELCSAPFCLLLEAMLFDGQSSQPPPIWLFMPANRAYLLAALQMRDFRHVT